MRRVFLITTTGQATRTLSQLEDDFLLEEDEFGNEYIIESVKRKNILYDNGHYVLNLKSAGKGCIKF